MEADRRTRLSPEARRAQLLALGVASLADRPLDDLTVEKLSAEAGVSRGLLFYYFGSRQGLHHQVVTAARDGMLHATQPNLDLAPLDRLHDTLTRLVRFVRDHSGTFYSLVRGAASGDREVREVVDEARQIQAGWVLAVELELGATDTPLLRVALRAWVSFVEQVLVDAALDSQYADGQIVEFLERSLRAAAASVSEGKE